MTASAYETPLLPLGTEVEITGGYAKGGLGTICKAYRTRHGHPMYDIKSRFGYIESHYAGSQLKALPEGMDLTKLETFRELEFWRTTDDHLHLYLAGLDKLTAQEAAQFTTWSYEQRKLEDAK